MWQRFSESTRRVIFFAQEEAARHTSNDVGTEHLLLGLAREYDSTAARILQGMGISLESVRQEMEKKLKHTGHPPAETMQMTIRAKQALTFATEEAESIQQKKIGTGPLLLGLLRVEAGMAARTLTNLGVTQDRVRQEFSKIMASEA